MYRHYVEYKSGHITYFADVNINARMVFVALLLLQLVIFTEGLTDDEIAEFNTLRFPNRTERNTGLGTVVNITDNGDGSLTVLTNTIPNHDTGIYPSCELNSPFEVLEHWESFKVYKEPVMREEGEEMMCMPLGTIGVAKSGTILNTPFAVQTGCPFTGEQSFTEDMDICQGHPSIFNEYHYHEYSPCVNLDICGQPSPLYGVAIDGIPIYGPFDEYGRQLTAHDLDKCGGKYDSTGRYKYHATRDPPYYMSCFKAHIRGDFRQFGTTTTFECGCPFSDAGYPTEEKIQGQVKKNDPCSEDFEPGDALPVNADIVSNCNETGLADEHMDCILTANYTLEGYEFITEEKTIKLHPCCPPGSEDECGDGCQIDIGDVMKSVCYVETRTINITTRRVVTKEDNCTDEDNSTKCSAPAHSSNHVMVTMVSALLLISRWNYLV